jgi:hypothetical protein
VSESPSLPACGTMAGYRRHYKKGEPRCDACDEARRDFDRELYRLNREHILGLTHSRRLANPASVSLPRVVTCDVCLCEFDTYASNVIRCSAECRRLNLNKVKRERANRELSVAVQTFIVARKLYEARQARVVEALLCAA